MPTLKIVVCPNRRIIHAPTFRWKDNTVYPSAADVLQKLDEGGLWLLLDVAGGKLGVCVALAGNSDHTSNTSSQFSKNAPIFFC